MKLLAASLAVAAVFVTAAPAQIQAQIQAQTPSFSDPANLRGERVAPRDGRELPVDQGARGLEQMLRRLNTRASLMLIVAHPDDEDGGMLTSYSRGMGARVAMMTLTRGEGGQNAVTGDFEDALGLLRTQELLAAGRYLGVDQMFGTEVDFGFSKTKEEAFAKWTHQRVLYDAVRAVRLYRPQVIAAVFIGGVTDGHGQHQVSGEIAQEVFKAAGDPKVFPELTAEGILPWQPLKMYARVPMQAITEQGLFDYATGQYTPARFTNYISGEVTSTAPSVDVVVHEGTPDPLLSGPGEPPHSYVQFARTGLGLQKSQVGPGMRTAPAGVFDVSYHRYGSRLAPAQQKVKEDSFFDGIDTSLEGMINADPETPPAVQQKVQQMCFAIHQAVKSYDSAHLADLAPKLAEALTQLQAIQQGPAQGPPRLPALSHELAVKAAQLQEALAQALDIRVHATSSTADITARATAKVHAEVTASPDQGLDNIFLTPVREGTIEYATPCPASGKSNSSSSEPFHRKLVRDCVVSSFNTSEVTRPYFTRSNIEQAVYTLLRPELRNAAASPPAIVLIAEFDYRGARFQVNTVVTHEGQPVQIIPPASLTLFSHAQVLPKTQTSVLVSLTVSPKETRVESELPKGWNVVPDVEGISATDTKQLRLIPPSRGDSKPVTLQAIAVQAKGQGVREGYQAVGYGDLPRTHYFTPATLYIVPTQLALPTNRRIGYLPGTGDSTAEALASVGLPSTTLTVADLTPAKLAAFDTVVLGVRTYAAHADLHGAPTKALLDYARSGGNVVIQYQTAEFTGDDAPFPLTLGRDAEKVVDETDAVKLLAPASPLLAAPNRLTPADFDGWVAERGHGFLRTWDPRYTALTETADPGEDPQRGGLVTTQLGRGHWTYCAFALYRQLPEAVPGAYRVFVNMLGLADAK